MSAYWLLLAVLVVLITFVIRFLASWFARHEEEANKVSERFFESPTSLQKIPVPSIFSEATKSLTIVIPAYNEEARLPTTLDETLRYLQKRRDRQGPNFTYEVIVVDDGSRDATVRVAFKYVRKHGVDAVRVLQLPRNYGKGYAVKAGMLVGRGERLLFMDADGATRVSDVEKLEAALATISGEGAEEKGRDTPLVKRVDGAGGAAMAVGSRAHLEAVAISRRAWYRNFLMHGFHFVVLLVAGGAIKDTQCGFKLFTRPAARALYSNQRLQRWCFDVELIFLAQRLGIPIVETSVNWTEIPGSKVSVTSIVHMTWEMAAILIGYSWLQLWHINTSAGVAQ
ncbi:Dolichyl-phosphate beta-glucosyltransferase [Coccomyxa sp. Obi]|nr:Dolichyl-phosphate beta-glucosyltransferase [Coccomyxa sp. Obi]